MGLSRMGQCLATVSVSTLCGRIKLVGNLIEEKAGLHSKGRCDTQNEDEVGHVLASLDLPHVRPLYLRRVREMLLREAQCQPPLPNDCAERQRGGWIEGFCSSGTSSLGPQMLLHLTRASLHERL